MIPTHRSLIPRQILNYGTSLAELYVLTYFTAAINGGKALHGRVNSIGHNRNELGPTVQRLVGVN
jgi:hypothetical protein